MKPNETARQNDNQEISITCGCREQNTGHDVWYQGLVRAQSVNLVVTILQLL